MGDNKLVNLSIIFIAVVIFVLMLKELQGFLRPFAIAIILTLLLMPLVRWSKKKGIPSWVSIVSVTILFFVVLAGLGTLVAGEGVRFAKTISEEKVSGGIGPLEQFLQDFNIGGKSLAELVDKDAVAGIASRFVKAAVAGVRLLFSELFVVVLFLIFLLPSHDMIVTRIKSGLSKNSGEKFESTLNQIEEGVFHYIMTKSLISLLTALSAGLILFLFGAELILALMIITFILEFIPNIGSTISVLASLSVYALTNGLGWPVLFLGVALLVVQNLFANFVEPKLTGKRLNMSPILILLSLFFWSWVWGLPGMVLSVPLTTIIKIALDNIGATKKAAKLMS